MWVQAWLGYSIWNTKKDFDDFWILFYFSTKIETILDFSFFVKSNAINSFQIIDMHIE